MTSKTATRAVELPLVQRHLSDSSAVAASLARVPRVDLHQSGTACDSLVFQHSDESIPGCIVNVFCEMMVLDHAVYVEFFNGDKTIIVDQTATGLVQKIHPLVCNSEMLNC